MILTLMPITPHICTEMLFQLEKQSLKALEQAQVWPSFDPALVIDEDMVIVVQINGKRRAEFRISVEASEEEIIKKAQSEVSHYLKEQPLKKTIYIKGKMVSLVI